MATFLTMESPIDKKIEQANQYLAKKGSRVVLYRRNNHIWLRGTLPPKPHIAGKDKDYRQFVSLGPNATTSEKGIKYAMGKAEILTGQLMAGNFAWDEWLDYARRCFEFGIAPDRAAKFMGHSLSVHLEVYRAWFDESVYLADYQKAIAKEGRPKPPS